ncbi:MAG: hypothetical protein UH850_00100 [Paludibacteraceae bacterium]|nr:hypothetical protein [Paludibacteraceae bacterium]
MEYRFEPATEFGRFADNLQSNIGGEAIITKYRNGVRIKNDKYDFMLIDFPMVAMFRYRENKRIAKLLRAELPTIEQTTLIYKYRKQINDILRYFDGIVEDELLCTSDKFNGCTVAVDMRNGSVDIDDSGRLLGCICTRFIRNIKKR